MPCPTTTDSSAYLLRSLHTLDQVRGGFEPEPERVEGRQAIDAASRQGQSPIHSSSGLRPYLGR
jgi:hypothetical protein